MDDLFEGLIENEIISNRNLNDIRQYISKKYPEMPVKERSCILANSINSILDRNIPKISGMDNNTVRVEVLTGAVKKNSFSVNAYEIFEKCLPHIEDNDENVDNITEWVNSNQRASVTRADIKAYISPDHTADEPEEIVQPLIQHDTARTVHDEIVYAHNAGSKLKGIIDLISKKQSPRAAFAVSITLCMLVISLFFFTNAYGKGRFAGPFKNQSGNIAEAANNQPECGLPMNMRYKAVDKEKLKSWLNKKDSMLSDEPYISAIINTAQRYDINPLFLVAITGQEQAFVPKSAPNSKAIANNPFNVYGSWKDYNTDIYDSAEIAARTIINLNKDKPSDADTIQWINRKYAEDSNWHIGVTLIFNQLCREVGI